jgi:hypothetical protein
MKILTGGCSFTAHLEEQFLAWPYHLENKGYQIVNTAEMASGNEIILERIISQIQKANPDAIIVMWSNPFRVDLFFNQESKDFDLIHSAMKGHTSYSNFVLNGKIQNHKNSNWIRTGGGYGIWKFGCKPLDKIFKNYLADYYNNEYQFIKNVRNILTLQTVCASLGVKLINTCWQNIWDDLYDLDNHELKTSNWITKESVKKLKNRNAVYTPLIDKFPNAKHWYDLIDWSTWLFYEKEGVKRGGIGEFAIIENNDELQNSHPSWTSQKLWTDFLDRNLFNRFKFRG